VPHRRRVRVLEPLLEHVRRTFVDLGLSEQRDAPSRRDGLDTIARVNGALLRALPVACRIDRTSHGASPANVNRPMPAGYVCVNSIAARVRPLSSSAQRRPWARAE
jgi:hypothetical protein